MNYHGAWMLLGRELSHACQSMNARGRCPAGSLLCILMKHLIIVSIEGTSKTLKISKDVLGSSPVQAAFSAEIYESENKLRVARTFTTVDGEQFLISGEKKQFTAREVSQEFLNMLCST